MSVNCNEALVNIGNDDCKIDFKVIKRIGFTSTKKEDGSYNTITAATAATKAGWQALFNKYNFVSDILEKVVVTPVIYEFADNQTEPEVFDVDGYYEELKDGTYSISFKLNSVVGDILRRMRLNKDKRQSVYFFDAADGVIARKSGTSLIPIEILSTSIQNLRFKTISAISQEMISMRVKFPEQMNELTRVQIADMDYSDDDDFFSLTDVETVISSPAVTGCVATLTTTRDSTAVTGLATGATDYLNWKFYDAVAPTVAISLSAAGDITETSDGVYTINKAALLTTAHVYSLKVSASGYDIEIGTVTVP